MSQIVFAEPPTVPLTPELRAALERFAATSACPRYLREAWTAAQR